jgi:hypothetical protein
VHADTLNALNALYISVIDRKSEVTVFSVIDRKSKVIVFDKDTASSVLHKAMSRATDLLKHITDTETDEGNAVYSAMFCNEKTKKYENFPSSAKVPKREDVNYFHWIKILRHMDTDIRHS